MCTFAWNGSVNGLWICFNRDESRVRTPAEYPEVRMQGDFPLAYARDPDGGGTWLAVSGAGYVFAIMNNYAVSTVPAADRVSRGRLVLSLAAKPSLTDARQELQSQLQRSNFAPFFLFLLGFKSQEMWSWDGFKLVAIAPCPKFWTTSSYQTKEVALWRTRQWEQRTGPKAINLNDAISILSEREGDPAYGFTMDRVDARTVSQSAIRLDPKGMRYAYAERQRDGFGYCPPVTCFW